jgi:membrane protein involved in colicin uptake
MELPECKETRSTHLPDAVIQKCLHKPHAPINPHSQRLLTAEARAAAKLPKAKAKATAKATAKAKSGESKAKGKAKKDKTDAEHQAESSVSRTAAIVYTWVASQKKRISPKV